jgi:hypothetical protein
VCCSYGCNTDVTSLRIVVIYAFACGVLLAMCGCNTRYHESADRGYLHIRVMVLLAMRGCNKVSRVCGIVATYIYLFIYVVCMWCVVSHVRLQHKMSRICGSWLSTHCAHVVCWQSRFDYNTRCHESADRGYLHILVIYIPSSYRW